MNNHDSTAGAQASAAFSRSSCANAQSTGATSPGDSCGVQPSAAGGCQGQSRQCVTSGGAPPMEPGFYNMDCMEALRMFPDRFFDLAIVDPPYGGGYAAQDHATGLHGGGSSWAGNERGRWGQRFDRYHIGPAAVSSGGGGRTAAWKRSRLQP